MDAHAAGRALALDSEWERSARSAWLALMDLAVLGDLGSPRLRAISRVRKRAPLDAQYREE